MYTMELWTRNLSGATWASTLAAETVPAPTTARVCAPICVPVLTNNSSPLRRTRRWSRSTLDWLQVPPPIEGRACPRTNLKTSQWVWKVSHPVSYPSTPTPRLIRLYLMDQITYIGCRSPLGGNTDSDTSFGVFFNSRSGAIDRSKLADPCMHTTRT